MSNIEVDGADRPRHSLVNRDCQNQNGLFIPNIAVYVQSGSIDSVAGGSTGSITMQFDTYGSRLKRVEVFHSGAAPSFDVSFESKTPNTGSDFDPRNIVVEYDGLNGSADFTSGIDKVEDVIALTDSGGKLYMKVKPHGLGDNWFKYLLFFEAVMIYINADRTFA